MEPARKRARYDESALMRTQTWKMLIVAAMLLDKMTIANAQRSLAPFYHTLIALTFNKQQAEKRYSKLADYRHDMKEFHTAIVEERLDNVHQTHWYFTVLNNFKNANYTAIDNCIYNAITTHYGQVDIDAMLSVI